MNRDQLVAGGVAMAAFACSAQHIYTVALDSGNPVVIAAVHPLGLDGLIYIGMRAVQSGRRWQGWLATTYGIVMSLTFNGVSYAHVPMPAWVMAVAMPLALVLAVLVVGHEVRDKTVDSPAPVSRPRVRVPAVVPVVSHPDVPVVVPQVSGVPSPVVPMSRGKDWDRDKARTLLSEGRPRAEIAELCGVSTKTISRLADIVAKEGVAR